MDIRIRLTRKPMTTALWVILTAAMALLVSVGAAMLYSSGSLTSILDGYHTSIAVRTDRWHSEEEMILDNGMVVKNTVFEDKAFDEQDAAYFESLDCVEEVYFHTMSAAYCPQFVPAMSAGRLDGFDDAYNNVMLVGEVTKLYGIEDLYSDDEGFYLYGELHIEQMLSQNTEFTRRNDESDEYLNFSFSLENGQEDYIQIGQRYVLLGAYDPLSYGIIAQDNSFEVYIFHPWINHHKFTDLVGDTIMYVDDYDDNIYGEPAVKPLNGAIEEFLADPENAAFVEALERLEKQNHSLVVMGTENLEAVYGFTSNAANIVQGRSFIQEEYDSGAKVCILGETVANASGISVGDTITLEQYLCEENNISVDDEPWDGKQNNPDIGRLNIRTEYGPAEEFTVVGLYRQRDEWGDSSYSFTPNTIFIPQAAQIDGAYGGPSREDIIATWVDDEGKTQTASDLMCHGTFGIFFSMKLKNGMVKEFEELMEADQRFGGQFLTIDQGFGEVMEKLDAVNTSTGKLTVLSAAGWVLLMALFVLLYQGSQRQNLGIMRALGASPRTAQRYLWGSGTTVAALGISIGTAWSAAVMNRVQSWLLADAIAVMPSRYSIGVLSDEAVRVMVRESQLPVWLLLVLALTQMALFGLVLLLHARQMARRSPRSLLSK